LSKKLLKCSDLQTRQKADTVNTIQGSLNVCTPFKRSVTPDFIMWVKVIDEQGEPISSFRFVTEEVSNGEASHFIDFQAFTVKRQTAPYITLIVCIVLGNYMRIHEQESMILIYEAWAPNTLHYRIRMINIKY
jgi:hypothetical protein